MPDSSNPSAATRWPIVGLALLAAALAAWLAPEPWESGHGALRVTLDDDSTLAAPVTLGSDAPLTLIVGDSAAREVRITFPEGVPLSTHIYGLVESTGTQEVQGVQLALVRPAGHVEPLPILNSGIWTGPGQWMFGRTPPRRSDVVLALLALVAILWVTNAVPLWLASLLVPIVVATTGVQSAEAALQPFFHPIIALFFGGFLMAEAMKRVGLDQRIAATLVARLGRSPVSLFAALVCVSAFLSMWMSNTASTALLIPIALAVTEPLKAPGYRRAVVLGLAYAATIGGIGSAIGTPANLLAIEFLGTQVGHEISFAGWFAIGLPVVLVLLPVVATYVWWRLDVDVDPTTFAKARAVAGEHLRAMGRPSGAQRGVAIVFGLIVAGWLTQQWHGVHPGIVALGGAAALVLLGYIRGGDLQQISWASLLTFGGGLALGSVMVSSGTSDWLATRLVGLGAAPQIVGVSVVALFGLLLTALASNTASAAILIPLAIPLASALGLDPVTLVLIVAVATSIDFALVIGTPPTMLAYATGLFTPGRIFRIGLVLDLVCIALLVSAVRWLWTLTI